MNVIECYNEYVNAGRWEEALPLIKEILERAPYVQTSWFNYGVCLDGLKRHAEAATAFQKAYELKEDDYGAQYRAFRSLALADDGEQFCAFLDAESEKTEGLFGLLEKEPVFHKMAALPRFNELKKRG
jgi:tetratricopeptide (TPR) repeat protein